MSISFELPLLPTVRRAGALRLALAAVLTLACTPVFTTPAYAQAAEEARAADFAQKLQASMQALEDGDREAPRDRWDPAYILETVGLDVEPLYGWVRTHVTWVPYRGALRGPVGVLMDRRGNSLDQALLLAELLTRAGHTVRLAHADLTPTVAADLLDALIAARLAVGFDTASYGPLTPEQAQILAQGFAEADDVGGIADAYGLDQPEIAGDVASSIQRANEVVRMLQRRTDDQVPRLLAASGQPGAAAARQAVLDNALAAIADHWWVQVQSGGSWVDLDVLSAQGAPGHAVAPFTGTADHRALPDELETKVVVRVVAEQLKEGQTREQVALEVALYPRALIGQEITLVHLPAVWPTNWTSVAPDDVQIKLRAALYSQHEWLPLLTVGGAQFARAGVKDTGELNENPSPANPMAQMSVPAIGIMTKAADLLQAGEEAAKALPSAPTAPRPEGELTAEWLELEFVQPGNEPHKVRREVFDLIGPAARARGQAAQLLMTEDAKLARSAGALTETSFLVMPSALAPEFTMHLLAQNAIANKKLFEDVARDPFGNTPANFEDIFTRMVSLPAALYTFAGMRFSANPDGAKLFLDRPLVVLQHGAFLRGKGGDLFVTRSIDIVDNRVGVDPAAAADAWRLRLVQGVIDTNAEAQAVRITGQPTTSNLGDAYASAANEPNSSWVAIRPEEPAKVASLELDENVSARIADDLASGQIVVAQAGLQSEGWWRIDPATGDALGMGPTGKGSVLAEYALVLIVQGIINAVQCKLAGAATAFIEKNIAELDKAAAQRDSSAGVKAAVAQGQESWKKNSNTHCFAVGIMGAFDAGLLFASFELAKRVSGSGRAPGLASTGGEPAKGTPGERPAPGEQAAKGEENRSPSPENSPPEQGEGEQPGAQNESPSRSEGPEQPSPEGQSNEQASNAAGEGEPNAQRANDADAANPTAEGGNPHVRRNDWKSAEDANNAVDQAMDKALEAKARNEANPTNENQAALDQALKDLRNLENDRANWMFENGQVPAARPPRPGASGPDSPPPTEMPPTEMPPTEMPPTEMPPTEMPPTEMPPTEMPPTEMPATEMPATQAASGAQPSPSQPPSMSPSAESVPTPQNIPPPTQRSPGVADPSPMANSVPPPAPGIQGQPVLSPSAGNQTLPGVGIPGASGAQSGNTITGVQEVKPVQVGAGNAAGLNPFAVTQRIPGQAPPATTTMTGLPPPPPTTTLAGANGLAGAFEGIAGNPTAEGTPEPP